jgi:hypothetical protein
MSLGLLAQKAHVVKNNPNAPDGDKAPNPPNAAQVHKPNQQPKEQPADTRAIAPNGIATVNGFEAAITGVQFGPPKLVKNGTPVEIVIDAFTVTVEVRVAKGTENYNYKSWGVLGPGSAIIYDQNGKTLVPFTMPGTSLPKGYCPSALIRPNEAITDVLVFWPPEKDAEDLEVNLPVHGQPGKYFYFVIPKRAWKQ